MRCIKIKLDIDGNDGVTATHPGVVLRTIGAAAPVAGFHYMEDVTIGGSIFSLDGASTAVQLFSDADWTAAKRKAVRIEGLSIVGGAGGVVNVDGRGLDAGSLTLRDIKSDLNLTQTNVTGGTLIASNAKFANFSS